MQQLGVEFELSIVASEIGSYKPSLLHWEVFLARSTAGRDRHAHVAASLLRRRCQLLGGTGGTSAALAVHSGYASPMIEERGEQAPQTSEPADTTSENMAEALDAARASSPSLGSALDAAGIKPDELVDAHEKATSDERSRGEGPTAG